MRNRLVVLAGAALAPWAVPALAQEQPAAAADRSQQFFRTWTAGEYLEAIAAIEDGWQADERLKSSYVQMRPALDGFVVMTEERRRPVPTVDPAELARYDGAEAKDAIAEIVERARRTRVVILNEAHDSPRDRAFVLAVAEALRPLGYSIYAAETLQNGGNDEQIAARMAALAADGYPRRGDGWYSSEPMFGNLIRGVLALGYRPLSYEYASMPEGVQAFSQLPRDEQVARREQGQAENLARAIAAAGADAKILIHVGYSHAAERPIEMSGKRQEWMAARLARLTGIDPLTIDQTDLSEFAYWPATRSLHAALAPRLAGRPTVFLEDGRPVASGPNAAATDLQVIHPPVHTVGGRPDWLQRSGRQAVAIPTEMLPGAGRRLIQAFAQGEAAEAVPVDQVLVRAGEEPPLIYVPAGMAIRWAVQDEG